MGKRVQNLVRVKDTLTSDREDCPGAINATLVTFSQSGSEPHTRHLFAASSEPFHWNVHHGPICIEKAICHIDKRRTLKPAPLNTATWPPTS